MSRPTRVERTEAVHGGTRNVLIAFTMFTLLATGVLLLRAAATDRYFAWTIMAEPDAAFLGAAYAAGFVLSVLALRRDRWDAIRLPVVTVAVFTVLTLTATMIHVHRLHLMTGGPMARFAAWLWLAVYLVIPVACLVVVLRQERRRAGSEPARRPMPRWLTVLLAAQGATLFAAGTVLFVADVKVHHMAAPVTVFWPWPLTPLSAEAIGAWLIAFGFAAAAAIWQRDLSRMRLSAVAYTAFGGFELLVALRYRNEMTADTSWRWAYGALLATIVATGAYGWWAAGRPVRVPSRGAEAAEPSPAPSVGARPAPAAPDLPRPDATLGGRGPATPGR